MYAVSLRKKTVVKRKNSVQLQMSNQHQNARVIMRLLKKIQVFGETVGSLTTFPGFSNNTDMIMFMTGFTGIDSDTVITTRRTDWGQDKNSEITIAFFSLDSSIFIRWFKLTLKPPYSITCGKLQLAIWDTSFWTFWVKFGHKGP